MAKRKVPHMLRADGVSPEDAEKGYQAALQAMREARKHPKVMTAREERDFLERRERGARSGTIGYSETPAIIRRGKIMYRVPGKGGADLVVPPDEWAALKHQRDVDAETVKATRRPPKRAPAHSREHIRTIAATVPLGRGRIKAIARAAGCSVDTVRRALSQ